MKKVTSSSKAMFKNIEAIIQKKISPQNVNKVLTIALVELGNHAATFTPIDTGNLVNSRYYIVEPVRSGFRGTFAFTASYAAAVHSKSGIGAGKPRDPSDPSRGNMWAPNGKPEFVKLGGESAKSSIDKIIAKGLML